MKFVLPCSLRHLFGSLALLFAANGLAQPGSQIGTTNLSAPRVLILSGGIGHDWRSSTFFLRQLLEEAGHDHTPFRHPAYRALVHNSILWTAGKLK